jgi:hypothetical protein
MSKQLAIIYFQRDQAKLGKSIANQIRNQGHLANLVYASNFKDAADCVGCASVAIQVDANNSAKIAGAYRNVLPDAEIHFFNTDGDFVDGPEPESASKIEMPPVKADENATENQPDAPVADEAPVAEAAPEAEVVNDAPVEEGDDAGETITKP